MHLLILESKTRFSPFINGEDFKPQSPTSDNHLFGWLPEVVRGRQMFVDDRWPVGNWLSENYIDNLSPTSDNHFFVWFSEVFGGRQIGC